MISLLQNADDCTAAPEPRVFSVEISRPDGTTEQYQRIGGTIVEHTSDAMDRAGLGGTVKVRCVPILFPNGGQR
jgi:hypothetical protein